jgi:hypothetical protein
MCAGLVTGPTQGNTTRKIRMPRELLELDASTWLVTDLGAWTGKTGAVWRIRINADNSTKVDAVISKLLPAAQDTSRTPVPTYMALQSQDLRLATGTI